MGKGQQFHAIGPGQHRHVAAAPHVGGTHTRCDGRLHRVKSHRLSQKGGSQGDGQLYGQHRDQEGPCQIGQNHIQVNKHHAKGEQGRRRPGRDDEPSPLPGGILHLLREQATALDDDHQQDHKGIGGHHGEQPVEQRAPGIKGHGQQKATHQFFHLQFGHRHGFHRTVIVDQPPVPRPAGKLFPGILQQSGKNQRKAIAQHRGGSHAVEHIRRRDAQLCGVDGGQRHRPRRHTAAGHGHSDIQNTVPEAISKEQTQQAANQRSRQHRNGRHRQQLYTGTQQQFPVNVEQAACDQTADVQGKKAGAVDKLLHRSHHRFRHQPRKGQHRTTKGAKYGAAQKGAYHRDTVAQQIHALTQGHQEEKRTHHIGRQAVRQHANRRQHHRKSVYRQRQPCHANGLHLFHPHTPFPLPTIFFKKQGAHRLLVFINALFRSPDRNALHNIPSA